MRTILFIPLFFLWATSVSSFATSYDHWELLYGDERATITKVGDKALKQNVMQFESRSHRDTYINGAKRGAKAWNNTQEKILRWQFNFEQSYVIIVSVTTLDGHRNILYTSGNDNGNLFFGLGEDTLLGEWQTITRDLEYDLHRYEPRNSIISVNAFLVRGSGKIAKVELLGALPGQKVTPKPKRTEPKVTPKAAPAEAKKATLKRPTNKLPQITLRKGELIYHKLGEPFFDPGVQAEDAEGKALEVDVIGEVNINNVNKYTLTYIATDRQGNTATQARVVMVYRPGQSEEKAPTQEASGEAQYVAEQPSASPKQVAQILESEELEEENLRQEEMLELLD